MLRSFVQFYRRALLTLRGINLPADSCLGRGVRCRRGWRDGRVGTISVGCQAKLEDGAILDAWGGDIRLGKNVFVGPYTVIYGHGGVEIGDSCLIAMHCCIVSSNHAAPPMGTDIRTLPDKLRPTRIGRDVWLGAGVTVLGGVTIGNGCIVGAGAVVTRNLPPGAIAYGTPAKVQRYREDTTG